MKTDLGELKKYCHSDFRFRLIRSWCAVDQRHTNAVRFCNGTNVGLLLDDLKVELSMTW